MFASHFPVLETKESPVIIIDGDAVGSLKNDACFQKGWWTSKYTTGLPHGNGKSLAISTRAMGLGEIQKFW